MSRIATPCICAGDGEQGEVVSVERRDIPDMRERTKDEKRRDDDHEYEDKDDEDEDREICGADGSSMDFTRSRSLDAGGHVEARYASRECAPRRVTDRLLHASRTQTHPGQADARRYSVVAT